MGHALSQNSSRCQPLSSRNLGWGSVLEQRLVSLKVLPSTDWGHGVTRSDGCLHCLWSWKVLAGRVGFSRVVHASCFSIHLESMAPAHVQISQRKGISQLPQGYHLIVLAAVFRGFSMYKGQMSSTSIILVPLEYLSQSCSTTWYMYTLSNGWAPLRVCLGQNAHNSSRCLILGYLHTAQTAHYPLDYPIRLLWLFFGKAHQCTFRQAYFPCLFYRKKSLHLVRHQKPVLCLAGISDGIFILWWYHKHKLSSSIFSPSTNPCPDTWSA